LHAKIQVLENVSGIFKDKLQRGKTGHVNNKDLDKRKHNQKHEIGKLKHACTEEYVTTVDELVGPLWQEGQKQTHRSTY